MGKPEYINCNLCAADDTELVRSAEHPFKVVRCKACGLIYVNPQPHIDAILGSYRADYYSEWIAKQTKSRQRLWKSRLAQLKKYKHSGSLLDVGCGDGIFLTLARDGGWEVCGTEISEYAWRYSKEKKGLNVFKGELKEANFGSRSFDCVTLWHTLEHTRDPLGTLTEISRILKDDGILIVEVPNVNNYLFRAVYRLVKRKPLSLFSLRDKEWHLFHFPEKNLKLLLEKANFQVVARTLKISQVLMPQRLLEMICSVIFWISRINIGSTFRLYARKA
ncbi:MAG: class I SAM-dependent methyltransferase [Candidatus Omnitrophica bacterium]|nr:class I SAM-dependent methyltransferase [Candidatus Omnitrophota bacterium]